MLGAQYSSNAWFLYWDLFQKKTTW